MNRLLCIDGMEEPQLADGTRWPARHVSGAGSEAVETADRFLTALFERDLRSLESLLDANVCSWWTCRGHLSSIEGATELSRALLLLVERAPPTRLDLRTASAASCVTSSLVDDALCWSLELNVEDGVIVGAFVRGADVE